MAPRAPFVAALLLAVVQACTGDDASSLSGPGLDAQADTNRDAEHDSSSRGGADGGVEGGVVREAGAGGAGGSGAGQGTGAVPAGRDGGASDASRGGADAGHRDAGRPDSSVGGGLEAGLDGSGTPGIVCLRDADCGAGAVCAAGACHAGDCAVDSACAPGKLCGLVTPFTCAACSADSDCRNDPAYGLSTVCVSGACTRGDCRTDGDCPNARVCGLSLPNVCAPCSTDSDCTAAAGYGAGYVCASGSCVRTGCASDADCAPGQICGLVTAGVCAPCGGNADCRSDATYGASTVCALGCCVAGDCRDDSDCSAGAICGAVAPHSCGACVSTAACRADPSYGARTVCVGGACVPGNCVTSADCAGGRICGVANAGYCGDCTADGQCTGDPEYGGSFICVVGACVRGDCERDGDCQAGHICGVASPNRCGACASDVDCSNDPNYGAAFVCNESTGTCVEGTCGSNAAKCAANPADVCCNSACVRGTCCSDSDCSAQGKSSACVDHVCTTCPRVTGDVLAVDPVGGSDAVGTGDATVPGCAFRSITRALGTLGVPANPDTRISVESGSLGESTGEVFPIVVPENVVIDGSAGTARVLVGANRMGFVLRSGASGIRGLTIDGQGRLAVTGILAGTGTASDTSLANLDVRGFAADGIRVAGQGVLGIGDGVSSTHDGGSGLHVSDEGRVTVNPAGAPVHFDGNVQFGIRIDGRAAGSVVGAPGAGSDGTVTTNANGLDGISIGQTPGSDPPPAITIRGVVSIANGASGIAITAGSNVLVRGSRFIGNRANGISVADYVNGAVRYGTTALIDLGTAAKPDYGGNVVQIAPGENPNLGAGICLAVDRTLGQILNAAGNVFAGGVDCGATPGVLNRSAACSNAVDVAVAGGLPTSNSVDVSQCR